MHGLLLVVMVLVVLDGMGWYWRVNDGRVSWRNVQHGKVIGSVRVAKSTMMVLLVIWGPSHHHVPVV